MSKRMVRRLGSDSSLGRIPAPQCLGRWSRWWLVAVLACLGFGSNLAQAQGTLRCDQSVVSRGFTFYEVLERCGDPVFEFSRVDYRYPGYTVQVDEWTYELGRNRFRRLLLFENGRLVTIETRSKPVGVRHSSFRP